MKSQKINGIVKILSAVIPILSMVGIFLIVISICIDVKELTEGPIKQVQQGLATLGDKVSDTTQVVANTVSPIINVGKKISKTTLKISRIPEEFILPAVSIPDLNLRIKPKVSIANREVEAQRGFGLPSAGDVLDGAKDAGKKVGSAAKSTGKKVAKTSKDVTEKIKPPKIEWKNINVKLPSTPATRVPVPGLKQAKSLLANNINLLGDLKNFLGVINSLDSLQNLTNIIANEREKLVIQFKPILTKGALLILLVLILLSVMLLTVYIIPYFSWISSQFTDGLALYRRKDIATP